MLAVAPGLAALLVDACLLSGSAALLVIAAGFIALLVDACASSDLPSLFVCILSSSESILEPMLSTGSYSLSESDGELSLLL